MAQGLITSQHFGEKPPAYPPLYFELMNSCDTEGNVVEPLIRVHPGRLCLIIHGWKLTGDGTGELDVEPLSVASPQLIIPYIEDVDDGRVLLDQYRMAAHSTDSVWLSWKVLSNLGQVTYVADSAEILFTAPSVEWVDPTPEDEGLELQHFVEIGSIGENEVVWQWKSDVVYVYAMIKGLGGSSSGSSSFMSSGYDSTGSDKSTAIVGMPWHPGKYGALFTMESNEVLFEFVVRDIPILSSRTAFKIDPRFLHVCAPDSIVVAAAPCGDAPYPVGAEVRGDAVILRTLDQEDCRPSKVTFKLTGVRKGFAGMDMPSRTREQYEANERFLNSAYPAS